MTILQVGPLIIKDILFDDVDVHSQSILIKHSVVNFSIISLPTEMQFSFIFHQGLSLGDMPIVSKMVRTAASRCNLNIYFRLNPSCFSGTFSIPISADPPANGPNVFHVPKNGHLLKLLILYQALTVCMAVSMATTSACVMSQRNPRVLSHFHCSTLMGLKDFLAIK